MWNALRARRTAHMHVGTRVYSIALYVGCNFCRYVAVFLCGRAKLLILVRPCAWLHAGVRTFELPCEYLRGASEFPYIRLLSIAISECTYVQNIRISEYPYFRILISVYGSLILKRIGFESSQTILITCYNAALIFDRGGGGPTRFQMCSATWTGEPGTLCARRARGTPGTGGARGTLGKCGARGASGAPGVPGTLGPLGRMAHPVREAHLGSALVPIGCPCNGDRWLC